MKLSHIQSPYENGFSLIELVAVLAILGILAFVALASGTPEARVATQVSVVRTHIRYAQSMAMKQARVHGFICDGSEAWVFRDTPATPTQLLGEAGPKIVLAGRGVALTAFTVYFDRYGAPYTDAALTAKVSAGNPAGGTLSSPLESDARAITITPDTGYAL